MTQPAPARRRETGANADVIRRQQRQVIAVVVTLAVHHLGGSSTALGTFFGALLLVLIVTTMQIAGPPAGMQDIVQGAVIIAVLALAGDLKAAGRPRRRTTGKEAAGG